MNTAGKPRTPSPPTQTATFVCEICKGERIVPDEGPVVLAITYPACKLCGHGRLVRKKPLELTPLEPAEVVKETPPAPVKDDGSTASGSGEH